MSKRKKNKYFKFTKKTNLETITIKQYLKVEKEVLNALHSLRKRAVKNDILRYIEDEDEKYNQES